MKVGIGYSNLKDPYKAGMEASQNAILGSGRPDLTIFFTTFRYNPESVFQGVKDTVGNSKIIGASSEGIILYNNLFTTGVGVLTLSGEELKIGSSSIEDINLSSVEAGEKAGKELLKSGIKSGTVIILFDKDLLDAYEMLYGLYNTMGPDFEYVGGGIGRAPGSQYTYKYTERGINNGPLVALLIDGINFSIVAGHGFTSIRDPLIITKTLRNKILEVDGIPAVSAYTTRLNVKRNTDLLTHMVLHPLGFPNLAGDFIIRDPIKVNSDQSISFSVDIPKGAVGYIMKGEINRLIETAGYTAKEAVRKINFPQFCLVFDCISRSSLMKNKLKLELQTIKNSIGLDIPILGMLSWGEISSNKSPTFHNKTTVVAIAGEGINQIKEEKDKRRLTKRFLTAELSILHEIASFYSSNMGEDFAKDVIEKTVRLFRVTRCAFLKRTRKKYKLLSSWGFQSIEEVLERLKREDNKCISFPLGDKGKYGLLYLEFNKPIEDWEKRIYTIFSRRLEEILTTLEIDKKRRRIERVLKELSLKDDLTGLYNRRGFFTLGEQHLKLSERLKKRSILAYIDVDNMKWINDNFGHSKGDEAIIEVANILKKTLRKSDIIARIGGDEFVFLGLETGKNNYAVLKERINKRIEARNKRKKDYPISLSIGIAIYDPINPTSLKALLNEADNAMYLEKKSKKSA